MLDPTTSVSTIVLDHSETAAVFSRHRIDYCCKGERSLADVCMTSGLDLDTMLDELEKAIASRKPREIDPRELSTRDVIVKLIAPHHQFLHRNLPFVQVLATKVARVHGDKEPSLRELARLVDTLVSSLAAHLEEEEQILFPALLGLRDADTTTMLSDMKSEHLAVGALLAQIRMTAVDYTPPAWACNSYRTLLKELAEIERDTLEHVHIENHVLAPRFARPVS